MNRQDKGKKQQKRRKEESQEKKERAQEQKIPLLNLVKGKLKWGIHFVHFFSI